MRIIYSKHGYNLYRSQDGFIVHRANSEFSTNHTHLDSFNRAKYIIDMAYYKRIPHHLSVYLLVSLIRITDDEEYQNKIFELIEAKKTKKQSYRNRGRCNA